ncbi:MAG: flippase-like domain-containing protein [Desulfobacterales bacterium]|nr:flippase-like domain-containing protein [Desulfobacterales bacterium]
MDSRQSQGRQIEGSIVGRKVYLRILGFLLLVFILSRIDFYALANIFSRMILVYYLLALLLLFPAILGSAWRWQILMKFQGIVYGLKECFAAYSAGIYLGLITPGKMGDLVKVFYLKNAGHSMGKASFSVLVDRLYDLFALCLFGLISLFIFFDYLKRVPSLSLLVVVITIVSILAAFYFKGKVIKDIIVNRAYILIPSTYKNPLKSNIKDFFKDVRDLNFRKISLLTIITLLEWMVVFILHYLLALSLRIELSFWYISACVSLSVLISLIPVSIAGIGTRDGVLVLLFSYLGSTKEAAIAFSFLILSMSIISGLLGFVFWTKRPLRF